MSGGTDSDTASGAVIHLVPMSSTEGPSRDAVLADSPHKIAVIARLDRAIQYPRDLSAACGNCRIKIVPTGIIFLDQRNLPCAGPLFQPLLSLDGVFWIVE